MFTVHDLLYFFHFLLFIPFLRLISILRKKFFTNVSPIVYYVY